MQKTIVTHLSPDLDGIPAIWLLKKFHPEYKNAKLAFTPAGTTLNNEPVGSDPNIVHVDTGGGPFDHHESSDFTCAAKLVFDFLVKEGYISGDDEALSRLVDVLVEIDHGWDNYKWPEPASDRNDFLLHNVLMGWKMIHYRQDEKYVEWVSFALEGVYEMFKAKVRAEKDLQEGKKFKTRWGEGVAIFTANSAVLDTAIKKGFAIAVTKDPKKGNVRVTGSNILNVDLTNAYEVLLAKDPESTWFLHASKVLLRNGSSRNPTMKATKLDLEEMLEILEKA